MHRITTLIYASRSTIGWPGRPIYFAAVFSVFFGHRLSRIGPSSARRYYTNSVAPGDARKISTDIRPMLPPFYRGKRPKFWPKILAPVVFKPPYFWTGELYRKAKTNLSRIDDGSTIIPTPRTVGAMVTQKGKSDKFIIYPPFQRPTPSTPPPMIYHLLGP